MKKLSLIVAMVFIFGVGAQAADTAPCERPLKHLNCQEIKDLAKRKGCEVEKVVCKGEPGAPGPVGPAGPSGPAGPIGPAGEVKVIVAPVPVVPPIAVKEHVRPLLGGGFLYGEEHNLGYQLFTGVQFAKDKWGHNWQLQFGPTWQKHNDANATCTFNCQDGGYDDGRHSNYPPPSPRNCNTHVNGAGPWGGAVSAVIVF